MRDEIREYDPIVALHADALGFPGGIGALAKALGLSAGTLHNKFSESVIGNEVSARQGVALAVLIARATGAQGYAEAVCSQLGGLFVPVPPDGVAADDDVLQELLGSMRALGQMAESLICARADGVIDPREFEAMAACGRDVQARIAQVLETVRTQVRYVRAVDLPGGVARG